MMDKLHEVLADVTAHAVATQPGPVTEDNYPELTIQRLQAMIACLDASPQPVYDQLCDDTQFWPERQLVVQHDRMEKLLSKCEPDGDLYFTTEGMKTGEMSWMSAMHGGPHF